VAFFYERPLYTEEGDLDIDNQQRKNQMAYIVTANDIENVLSQYSLRVSDTQGKSFETMAAELVDELDMTTVVEAASKAETETAKGQAVFEALHKLLVNEGIIDF
jgi:flagellar hook-basal body complex protein FliE